MKRKPLGNDPLKSFISGKKKTVSKGSGKKQKTKKVVPEPVIKKKNTTTTPGGLLRKSVYFTENEWQAIRKASYEQDRNYSDIIRECVRESLKV